MDPLALLCIAYVVGMFALAARARGEIHELADFVVAGRSLSGPMATATLLATWFGAGTLLAAADEVHATGLTGATLDPLGAGLCLILSLIHI